MIRARARKIDARAPSGPMGSVSSIRRPSALDEVPDAAVRAGLADGDTLAFGPDYMLDADGYVMAASWDGQAFKVFDACADWRGTYASWAAAECALVALGAEWRGFAR